MPDFIVDPQELDDAVAYRKRQLKHDAKQPKYNTLVNTGIGASIGAGAGLGLTQLVVPTASVKAKLISAGVGAAIPALYAAAKSIGHNSSVDNSRELLQIPGDDLDVEMRKQERERLRAEHLAYIRRMSEAASNGAIDSDMRRALWQDIGLMPEVYIRNTGSQPVQYIKK